MILIFLLLTQLSIGSMITLLAVPLHETGRGYFRFTSLTSLFLLGIAFFLWSYPLVTWQELLSGYGAILFTNWTGRTLLLLVVYTLLVLLCFFVLTPERPSLSRKLLGASVLAGILVLICLAMVYRNQLGLGLWWENLLFPGNFLTSALLLGSASFAMVLGHWYLVTPDLSIDPLRSLSLLFIGSLILRLVLILLTLGLYWTEGETGRQLLEILLNLKGYGVFFWFRLLFGLLAPLACSYMIWETVKIRSTQSATGMLYVTMLFVLAGELLARFLLFVTKIPV
ncbi:MAG TPA: hypothetical protein VNM22_10815 [Candidatus Limnocylindrales bacterium]|nr:hypothetical protein [Candidatus Limnocylindrales bacterium]